MMPRDVMSSEPRHWIVFGQLVMPVQCCAEARQSAQHCTAMINWPNTIQCIGSDDIMSLGIKSFATEGVGTKACSGNSQWVSGFMMDSWIHDGFLDSRWVLGFTMGSWIHEEVKAVRSAALNF